MPAQTAGLIVLDRNGVARIAGGRIKVTHLVLERQANGWDSAEICRQHPELTSEQVEAAFEYYDRNRADLDAQIRAGLEMADRMRAEAGPSPFLRRVKGQRKSG